jgi:hypothetical protein
MNSDLHVNVLRRDNLAPPTGGANRCKPPELDAISPKAWRANTNSWYVSVKIRVNPWLGFRNPNFGH